MTFTRGADVALAIGSWATDQDHDALPTTCPVN